MAINQRLDLRQSQTLTMTPQLQQAIKLLQMSNLELAEFVEAELEKNPLLEREDGPTAEKPAEEAQGPAEGENGPNEEHAPEAEAGEDNRGVGDDFESAYSEEGRASGGEGGYDAFATNSFANVGKGGSAKFEDPDFSLENTMAGETTLRDHLTEQIRLEFTEPKDLAIALLFLDTLDESGYMRADLAQMAQRLGCAPSRLDDILSKLQGLDPAGVFARNLSECLALQLRELNRLDPAMQALLDNLDALAKLDFKKLKAVCGVDDDDLKGMVAEIKALNPKPALAFDHFVAQTVVPDVLMRPLPKSKGGGWTVELNHDTLPRVLLNRTYCAQISKNAKTKTDKEYVTGQMNAANWLIRAMDQRAQTILKVASEIIRQQEAFFNYGVEFLKPLVLRDVAAAIEMHESTVSRVTTGKYLGTPRGVFELKYFFTSGVSSTDGAAAFSSEAIKARIKTLIDAEAPGAILSDDDLVDTLTKEGIDIARRTVAKYREALKIPSSVQRRRQKNA